MPLSFPRHSASEINLFVEGGPAAVILKHAGVKDPMNANMAAGIASEDGVREGLLNHDMPIERCVNLAVAKFNRLMALKAANVDGVEKKRKQVPDMVTNALEALRPYGTPQFPDSGQHKIDLTLEGVKAPFVGYLDFYYPEHGLIVDLKTTTRMPSAVSPSHARQGAIYGTAMGNHEVRFAYATPKECRIYRQEDIRERIEEVRTIAQTMERFFSQYESWMEAARFVVPNYTSFYMSSPTMRAAGKQLWGF